MGPNDRVQSQLHLGVLSVGQVILYVSLSAIPQEMISQELDPSATRIGIGRQEPRCDIEKACTGLGKGSVR
ncbi:hypothetical protein YTPLAS18_13670 [Nitrospira sp.]|nr:hypothetical protein YTPLAS18_13670 [Nitrospira sp.]